MKEMHEVNGRATSWLSTELWYYGWIDNMQYVRPIKDQTEGNANNQVDGTSRLFQQVTPFKPQTVTTFAMHEGNPDITYFNQRIPAPLVCLPWNYLLRDIFVIY